MNDYIIYGLVDPDTLLVRYIGKSTMGLRRPRMHLKPPRKSKTYCAKWVRALDRLHKQPIIAVLEVVQDPDRLCALEIWWIAYGKACDWPLTNLTPGGDGRTGHSPSPETRTKIGAASRARMNTPEALAAKRGPNNPSKRADVKAKIGASSKERMSRVSRNSEGKFVARGDAVRGGA